MAKKPMPIQITNANPPNLHEGFVFWVGTPHVTVIIKDITIRSLVFMSYGLLKNLVYFHVSQHNFQIIWFGLKVLVKYSIKCVVN